MGTFRWVLVLMFAFDLIAKILTVGRFRNVISPLGLLIEIAVTLVMIYGIFNWM